MFSGPLPSASAAAVMLGSFATVTLVTGKLAVRASMHRDERRRNRNADKSREDRSSREGDFQRRVVTKLRDRAGHVGNMKLNSEISTDDVQFFM